MTRSFPVRFPSQLRQHLRALRHARGLSQSQVGALLGVSQARIAEIEANPGLVNFEQLMKLLSVLGATVALHEEALAPAGSAMHRAQAPTQSQSRPARSKTSAPRDDDKGLPSAPSAPVAVRPKKGSW